MGGDIFASLTTHCGVGGLSKADSKWVFSSQLLTHTGASQYRQDFEL